MDPKLFTWLVMAALIIWSVYRRMRRTIGRQRVQEGAMMFRIALFVVVAALIALSVYRNTNALGGLAAGLAIGAALAVVGLRHTQFEVTPQGRFYTPHTYIGLIVTALFLGRVIYRIVQMYSAGHGVGWGFAGNTAYPGTAPNPDMASIYQRSPLTVGILGVVLAYYAIYGAGVLLKTRSLAEQPPTQSAPQSN